MTERQSISDRHVAGIRRMMSHRCPDCGGPVPLAQLTGRRTDGGTGRPTTAVCDNCNTRWQIALSRGRYCFRIFLLGTPLVFVSLAIMSLSLEWVLPVLSYEAANGQTKLSFWAFPFLVVAFWTALIWLAKRMPLVRVDR